MRKRGVYLILVVLVLAGVLVVVFRHREREPEYGGKRLSEWVALYDDGVSPQSSQSQEAAAAIRQIGSNAIPFLLKWIRYETPGLEKKLNSALDRLNHGLSVSFDQIPPADSAASAFRSLGVEAEMAIPQLIQLLNDPKAESGAVRAVTILGHLGKNGLFALLGGATNQQTSSDVRGTVVLSLVNSRTGRAVPAVLELLYDNDPLIRKAATNALLVIDPQALGKARNR